MQVSTDEFPDIYTMNLVESEEKPVDGKTHFVEVVTYGDYTKSNIVDFLKETKLSPKKSYDDMTTILCEIDKSTTTARPEIMHELLKPLNPKPHVYLIGKIAGQENSYRLVQVWPIAGFIEFDLATLAPQYPEPHNVLFTLSSDKKSHFWKTDTPKPTPFEVFRLNETSLRRKYNTG